MRFFAISILIGVLVLTAFTQTNKPKGPAKPKPGATSQKRVAAPQTKASENSEWEKAIALTDPVQRVAALKKFVAAYIRSTRMAEALTAIVTAEAGLGNDKFAAGDTDGAAEYFRAAANDAPNPIPQQLYTGVLSKFPANLYFRGLRDAGVEIAKKLEDKAGNNLAQLLDLANFYVSIENGSEAKRLAENALKVEPNSSAGYQMLGLANRVDFQLEESAAAYAKAVELDPEAFQARRGLAEMDRSLGKSEEAIALYREILVKDEANVPARTGLILALFEAGHRSDAEAEMAKSLDENPGNVMLLAGAAYWYAVHDEGAKAVALAQKAIDADPRFIWSHIALARGLLSQKRPLDAERVLLIARRYGNFPTLEYEIASARLAAGLYRDAAEELSKSFSVKDGSIHTNLGGRVSRESKYFTELIGFERRASIFAPTAADNPENAAKLAALLQFKQELDSAQPDTGITLSAVDSFVLGDDPMKVHREIFAASQLLEKKVGFAKALGLAKAAPSSLEAGLKVPDPVTPVLASELYETRTIALARGEYLRTPDVPAPTLSAILRGRIEDLTGWSMYETDNADQAAIHLRRAVGVLPADSAWWRASNWRLGNALALAGKDAEALDAYIKTYKAAPPDPVRYNAIEALYKRLNGSTEGLEAKVGPNPSAQPTTEVALQKPDTQPVVEQSPLPTPTVPLAGEIVPTASVTSTPVAVPVREERPNISQTPAPEPSASPTADTSILTAEPTLAASPANGNPTPNPETTASPTPAPEATTSRSPESTSVVPAIEDKPKEAGIQPPETKKELFAPVIITIPPPDTTKIGSKQSSESPEPSPSPTDLKREATLSPTPIAGMSTEETKPSPAPSPTDSVAASEVSTPSPLPTPDVALNMPSPSPLETPANTIATPSASPSPASDEITHTDNPGASSSPSPAADEPKPVEPTAVEKKVDANIAADSRPRMAENKPTPPAEIEPCTLNVSEESVTLRNGGGEPVMIGRADESEDLDGLTAVSTSPENVSIRRENIEGIKARAIFVVRSISAKPGIYQIKFELPCGSKEIVVKVR